MLFVEAAHSNMSRVDVKETDARLLAKVLHHVVYRKKVGPHTRLLIGGKHPRWF